MISIFLSTATINIIFSIISDNKQIYFYNEKNDNDLSSRILSIIDNGFKETGLLFTDVNKIFIVNGPGSFTGTRIGVTFAKVAAWSLKIDIIPISSLEMLASTSFHTKYVIPLIDARRNYVYCGGYDKNLNCVISDKHILLSDLINSINVDDYTFISEDVFDFDVVQSNYNIVKLVDKHMNDVCYNPHLVNPNYLKLTEAEERFINSNDSIH